MMPQILNAIQDFTKKARFQRDAEESKDGVYNNPDDTGIYGNVNVMAIVSEDLQKPTEDTFQSIEKATEKRYTSRTAALCLGLLTLLLLAGMARLGISDTRDQIQANCKTIEEVKNLREENAHLKSVNRNITNERDELQKMQSNCCPQNWKMFHNHCYIVSNETKPWSESMKDCKSRQANLVIITSDAEQDYISGLEGNVWIGLKGHGNNWTWVDGSPLTKRYWGPNQPDGINKDCVVNYMPNYNFNQTRNYGVSWNNFPCGYSRKWICEK